MKNKKIWIFSCISVFLGLSLYFFLPMDMNLKTERKSVPVTAQPKEESQQKAEESTEDAPETSVETSEQPLSEQVKERFKGIIEHAKNLFSNDKKIVAIGDSLTEGAGDETKNGGYVGILNHTFEENHMNISIENLGKSGNRTDQLLKRLETEEVSSSIKEADVVFITIGANDIMKVVRSNYTNLNLEPFQEERVQYIERLRAIFTKINQLSPDTKIFLIGFYNPFEGYFGDIEQLNIILNEWNQASETVTEQFENVYYIPTEDIFSTSTTNLFADDNFHPNTSGYQLMAERVLEYVKKYSEEMEIPLEEIE